MRAFEQFSEEEGAGLTLVGLAGETQADREDAAHDCRKEHAFSDEGIRDMRDSSWDGAIGARFLADAVNHSLVRRGTGERRDVHGGLRVGGGKAVVVVAVFIVRIRAGST